MLPRCILFLFSLFKDAVVSFLNETIYTPENGTLTIPIFVQSMGSFQIPLVVQLTFVSTPLASK